MPMILHIERLVLEGIDMTPGQAHLLQRVVETELAYLFGAGDSMRQLRNMPTQNYVHAPSFQLSGNPKPDALGQRIAKSVYQGISR